jgi:hypothetical protein
VTPSGRSQIVALLQPAKILAPCGGSILDAGKPGTASIRVASLPNFGYGFEQTTKVRSPISGRIRSIDVPTRSDCYDGDRNRHCGSKRRPDLGSRSRALSDRPNPKTCPQFVHMSASFPASRTASASKPF